MEILFIAFELFNLVRVALFKVFKSVYSLWRNQMETFSTLLALYEGKPPVDSPPWIPLTKASDAQLWCFLWCAPKQTAEETMETPVISDTMALIVTSL